MRTVAGMHEMRMAIDQPGRDPAVLQVDPLARVPCGREFRLRADESDAAIFGGNRAAFDNAETRTGRIERGEAGVQPDRVEQHEDLWANLTCLYNHMLDVYCHPRGVDGPAVDASGVTRELFFEHALLPEGWARDVRVGIDDGVIASVVAGATADGVERRSGIAIPGLPNLHCHAFQRGMAALAERRGPVDDSFWTWRELMYRFLARLTPDDVEAIAAFAYMEMLEAGYTTVAEFHYLHHDADGRPYADLGELAARIASAASVTGIGLTLLPSLYMSGGIGGQPPVYGQRRFLNDIDRFNVLVERSRTVVRDLPEARVGIAPHSLRAVSPDALRRAVAALPEGPIHIHAAEQMREVEDCVAILGARPVEWLLANCHVDARWCLIHTTHMTPRETDSLARSGAVAGLCPLTEASLGDGIFNGADYLAAGGRFGIGTDSNIQVDAAAELRQLEYGQRLSQRARNVLALQEGESVGRCLFDSARAGATQACARPVGAIAVGRRADIVLLDERHPDLAVGSGDHWLDAWIFVVGRSAVKDVLIGGEIVVSARRHHAREIIERRYVATVERLMKE
jgi:formimidoylglutamate deiminase